MSEEHLDEVMKIEEESFSVPWSRKSIQDAASKTEKERNQRKLPNKNQIKAEKTV